MPGCASWVKSGLNLDKRTWKALLVNEKNFWNIPCIFSILNNSWKDVLNWNRGVKFYCVWLYHLRLIELMLMEAKLFRVPHTYYKTLKQNLFFYHGKKRIPSEIAIFHISLITNINGILLPTLF